MRTILITLIAFCGFTSFGQTNFKHDIGLRLSSNELGRFRLDYRFHPNERWAFSFGGYYGSSGAYYGSGMYLNDSTYEAISDQFNRRSYGVIVGAQRKLNFMKHNYYYVGADLGAGATNRTWTNTRLVYSVEPTSSVFTSPTDIIEQEYNVLLSNAFNVNSRIFIGADVPIVDRLSFNLEVGIFTDLEVGNTNGFQTAYVDLLAIATGGLRYRFGKVDAKN